MDESHALRTTDRAPDSRNTEAAVATIKAASRAVLLSGTPSLSRPYDLFRQVASPLNSSIHYWELLTYPCSSLQTCSVFQGSVGFCWVWFGVHFWRADDIQRWPSTKLALLKLGLLSSCYELQNASKGMTASAVCTGGRAAARATRGQSRGFCKPLLQSTPHPGVRPERHAAHEVEQHRPRVCSRTARSAQAGAFSQSPHLK